MITNPLITNSFLKNFIEQTGLRKETRVKVLERLPYMNEKERRNLLDFLKKIYVLYLERDEEIKRLKEGKPDTEKKRTGIDSAA